MNRHVPSNAWLGGIVSLRDRASDFNTWPNDGLRHDYRFAVAGDRRRPVETIAECQCLADSETKCCVIRPSEDPICRQAVRWLVGTHRYVSLCRLTSKVTGADETSAMTCYAGRRPVDRRVRPHWMAE